MEEPAIDAGNELELLIDGAATFRRVVEEIEAAERDILVLQLLNKPDFVPEPPDGPTLNETLLGAARRGVAVRILLNSNWLAPDDWGRTRRWFAARREGVPIPVRVRRYPLTPGVAHAKMLLVDGERCLMVDPPFEPRWWDTSAHNVLSRRRGPGLPQHNVSAVFRGPIVRRLHEFYRGLWDARAEASGDGEARMPDAPLDGRARGPLSCRVVETLPDGTRGILRAYERELARAQRFFYVENQYFTSLPIARAIRAALERNPQLQVIALINERPDAWGYRLWQRRRLGAIGWPDHPRFGAFSLWSIGVPKGRIAARPIYIHSKVAIADDRWGTLGSANLDDISLDTAREFGFQDQRSIELNVELLDGCEGQPATGDVAALRRRLWSEHLGLAEDELRDAPPGGWLALWRERADQALRALHGQGVGEGFVLPYNPPLPSRVRRMGETES